MGLAYRSGEKSAYWCAAMEARVAALRLFALEGLTPTVQALQELEGLLLAKSKESGKKS